MKNRTGVYLYSLATVAAGIMDLVWGDFEAAHQPVQALSDHIPGRQIFAYFIGVWMVAGGAAMLSRRTARAGAAAVAVVYFIFTVFWLPRLYTAPHALGFRIPIFIGVLAGVLQQLILVVAGVIVCVWIAPHGSSWQGKSVVVARWTFGLGSVVFGLVHLIPLSRVQTAAMVPKWLPLGGEFWAIVTGICFVLAGVAILSTILDVLAARLLALMLLVFSAMALAPLAFSFPREHVAWGSNAYNLAAVGGAWIIAEALASRHAGRELDTETRFAEVS